jgi:hypothetical protein
VELTLVEQPALLDKVITADPMADLTHLTIQVVVVVVLVQLDRMLKAAVLRVQVVQVRLGSTELPTQVVVEAVITSMLLVVLVVAAVVAKVDTELLKAA